MQLRVLFENDDYVAIHKPSGLLSIPDRHDENKISVQQLLQKSHSNIFTVHRIDKDTSGCMLFAKHEKAHQFANSLFENRKIEKKYHAIVHGILPELSATISEPIMEHPTIKGKMMVHQKQGKQAITDYKVLEQFGTYSYVECTLLTGRTHQIRVHLSNIGNPIICDSVYGLTKPVFISSMKKNYHLNKNELEEKPILNRLALHAYSLSFVDPDGNKIDIECALEKDMNVMLKQCRKWLKS